MSEIAVIFWFRLIAVWVFILVVYAILKQLFLLFEDEDGLREAFVYFLAGLAVFVMLCL